MIDFATLTGAARIALGAYLPALFCNDGDLTHDFLDAGLLAGDPLWNLPLHDPYRRLLESTVADLSNVASTRYGGAITARALPARVRGPGRALGPHRRHGLQPGKPARPSARRGSHGSARCLCMLKARYGGTAS